MKTIKIAINEVVSKDEDHEVKYTDIYPPMDKCPYESTEVWCCRIIESARPIFKRIMKSRVIIDWAEIENELVAEYISTSPYEITNYDEKYIHHRFMRSEKERYKHSVEVIDSAIDSIVTNIRENSNYIHGGHLLKAKIINDVARRCVEDGILDWLPSYTAYIEAVLAKTSFNS
jgi:hypothetical protein